jgi:hypothetical protein
MSSHSQLPFFPLPPPITDNPYPDFYLVGAPKCGTTAFYDFLRQHPEIYLPVKKELLAFGSDLSYPTSLSEREFLAHFARRTNELRAGTAHTAYMQSTRAAAEIKAKRPDADIIVMLRNPVEMIYSWHSELLYQTIEDIADFEAALDAEDARRRGERVPRAAKNSYVESLYYTRVAAFAEQLERYFDTFGRAHVHVIVHDDLVTDPRSTYENAVRFLGVDPGFEPDFATVNANKVIRSRNLQRLYFATSAPGHALMRRMVPKAVRQRLLSANIVEAKREKMTPAVRNRLERSFRPEIARLSALLDRDFSSWAPD